MNLIIKGRGLFLNNNEVLLDDLFTKEFFDYSNQEAGKYNNDTYGVNEIFLNIVQEKLALERFVNDNIDLIDSIDIGEADIFLQFFSIDIAIKRDLKIINRPSLLKTKVIIIFYIMQLGSFIKLMISMLKIPYSKDKPQVSDNFAVFRFSGQIPKTKRFVDIYKELESPFEKNTIYRYYTRPARVGWTVGAYLKSFRTIKKMKEVYRPVLGDTSVYSLSVFYQKRIVYAELYTILLDHYFRFFRGKNYYMMNNLDRYSVIEDKTAHKYNIKTFNIPHGIEYGFKFPKGFASDVFYTYADNTATYLNKMYNTTKYVYRADVMEKLLSCDYEQKESPRIVFFTEPREIYVNQRIIENILPIMKERGLRLYLKLHGDKPSDYSDYDVTILANFAEAITGNICFARKSTILLEAIYNHSVPIAIITNPKDNAMFENFPSLNTDKIIKTFNENDLMEVVEKEYQNLKKQYDKKTC